MNNVARGQCFISIVLWLEFSASVLSRLATPLFTFGGRAAGPPQNAQWRDCAAESEGGTFRRVRKLKLGHAVGAS